MSATIPRALVIALIAAVLATGCAPTAAPGGQSPAAQTAAQTQAPQAQGTGTLNVWLSQKVIDLHPLAGTRSAGWLITTYAFQDMLYAVGTDNKYEPRLAQSWELSADAKTWTFRLRRGMKWSDGQPFSSKDVLFSWKLYMTPDASDHAGKLTGVKGRKDFIDGKTQTPAGMRAPDPDTFVIELDEPNSAFLANFAWPPLPIIPEHVLGSVAVKDLKTHPFFRAPTVSMGPFKFVRWVTDQFIELERNPNYWKPVRSAKLFLREMDANVALTALEKGELDLILTTGDDADRLAAVSHLKVETATSPGINKMSFTYQDKPPLNDARVRRALLYATDREGIIKTVYKGRGSVVNTDLRAPGTVADGLERYAFNTQKAKELLAEATWDPNRVFKLSYPVTAKDRAAIASIIQANWAAAGIKVELMPLEQAAFTDSIVKKTADGALVGGGVYTIDGNSVAAPLSCTQFFPNGVNLGYYCNPKVDSLFKEALTITDQEKRNAIYRDISKITNQDVSHLWLVAADSVYARNQRLKGFKPNGDATTFTVTIADWSVD